MAVKPLNNTSVEYALLSNLVMITGKVSNIDKGLPINCKSEFPEFLKARAAPYLINPCTCTCIAIESLYGDL